MGPLERLGLLGRHPARADPNHVTRWRWPNDTERLVIDAAKLQAFCTQAAMHIPIKRDWAPDQAPAPWGCVLGTDDQHPLYCDECPAKDFCPNPSKAWSQ